ncbi:MAG TPA: WS/DGAT domain-containing protein, partial [Actinomycetota bacterium]|nr:WS/DGAT domain-containing protein [Actinomycetota bacterium]
VGPGRRWAMAEAPVHALRQVREALGGTVNDVVLAAVAGALHRWLRAHGEPTRGRSLRALVPVSLRRVGAGPSLGNRLSAVLVDLPVGPMGARRRLRLVSERTARLKASAQATGVAFLVGIGSWAPSPLHALAAWAAGRLRFVNLAVSNVPGPEVPLSVAGARVLAHYPALPLAEGMGLSIGCTSLADTMGFGVTAAPETLSDVEALAAGLAEAVEELRQAASHPAGRQGEGSGRTVGERAPERP